MRELTAIQLSVVALLAVGLTSKEAAARLGISWRVCHRRLELARKRMGCATVGQLLFKVGRDLAHEVEEEAHV